MDRMLLLLLATLCSKSIADPNCDQISRSGVAYKFPIQAQQTKTVLYQLPYQNIPKLEHQQTYQIPIHYENHKELDYHLPVHNINQQFQAIQHGVRNGKVNEYQEIQGTSLNPIAYNAGGYVNFLPNNYYTAPISYNPLQIIKPNYPVKVAQPTSTVPQNYHLYTPQVKGTPLFYNQVYHPILPYNNVVNYHQPPKPQLYNGFQPIVTPKPAPPHHQQQQEKEEVNDEEEEEDHENQEEEEQEPQTENPGYKKQYDFNENFFKNAKYKFPRFNEGEKEEVNEEEEEEDEDNIEESIKRYVYSPYKYVGSKTTYKKPKHVPRDLFKAEKLKTSPEVKKPKTEFKMYHYTKSLKSPPVREYIEGRGSETVPVVHTKKQSFRENWYVSESTKN